jgi:chromosome segregation ATPase
LANEQTTTTENQTPTPEDKQDLKAQLEAEKQERDKLVAEATQPLQEQIATLGAALKDKDAQLAKLTEDFEGAKAAYAFAVADFKQLVITANPLFTEDLIAGNTIEELKASAEKASGVIAKLREGLEKSSQTEAAAARIPAGAPPRKEPDISSMSTTEKINYGLEQAKKKK